MSLKKFSVYLPVDLSGGQAAQQKQGGVNGPAGKYMILGKISHILLHPTDLHDLSSFLRSPGGFQYSMAVVQPMIKGYGSIDDIGHFLYSSFLLVTVQSEAFAANEK